jgi:hypothetical protein
MAHTNKINRLIGNAPKMTFPGKMLFVMELGNFGNLIIQWK